MSGARRRRSIDRPPPVDDGTPSTLRAVVRALPEGRTVCRRYQPGQGVSMCCDMLLYTCVLAREQPLVWSLECGERRHAHGTDVWLPRRVGAPRAPLTREKIEGDRMACYVFIVDIV